MKLIIDIPDKVYNFTMQRGHFPYDVNIAGSIIDGKIIPNEWYKSRTGEWKHNNFDEHYCNKCGHYALWSEEADGYYEVQSDFCPNCGADMRKGAMKNEGSN